jgi:pimeloyl-ACP methyl ester carboxylesterase
MAATHHKAMANGQTLHYVREGSGPPVLLLHGWPATWTHWRKLMPLLAHKHTVIAPDLRGFGDSSKPPTGYDTRSITGDVRALMQQLDLGKKTLVVGHDMGAVHAYTYAAEYPDEVAAFAYLDEPLPGLSYESFAALKPEPMWQGGFWFAHFHLVPQLPEALTAGRERLYLRHIITRMAYDPSVWSEADFDELERTFGGGGLGPSIGVYRDIALTIAQNKEAMARGKLAHPVLALGGAFGMGEVPGHEMRQVADRVETGVLAECGHFLAEEQPAELAQRLLTFFAKVSA